MVAVMIPLNLCTQGFTFLKNYVQRRVIEIAMPSVLIYKKMFLGCMNIPEASQLEHKTVLKPTGSSILLFSYWD